MGKKDKAFPRRDTQAYRLLELAAICGELPAGVLHRLPGGPAYKAKVVTALKGEGLLRLHYSDGLRGYRLGRRAKASLLADSPGRFSFYLTGDTDTNAPRSEVPRRLRLHRVAEAYVLMMNAGAAVYRDEKPDVFTSEGFLDEKWDAFASDYFQAGGSAGSAFYGSREVKELGLEAVKIRGSRMAGVLLAPSGVFLTYNGGPHMARWDYRAELRAQALVGMAVRRRGLSGRYAAGGVSGLLLGDGLEPFYRIFSSADSRERCFFLLDGNYEHFYYLTNDRKGEALLRLLCDPRRRAALDRILSQGLGAGVPGWAVENDAMDGRGNPVLFGYLLDIPRISRFHAALQLQDGTGTLVCFDFQCDVLRRCLGERVELSAISLEKFEGRFYP